MVAVGRFVRGHERLRIARGTTTLEPSALQRLQRRGYRVYLAGAPLHEADEARLTLRGVAPPQPTEWIAIRSYWCETHRRAPPNTRQES
jgi:hypothetical protein